MSKKYYMVRYIRGVHDDSFLPLWEPLYVCIFIEILERLLIPLPKILNEITGKQHRYLYVIFKEKEDANIVAKWIGRLLHTRTWVDEVEGGGGLEKRCMVLEMEDVKRLMEPVDS